MCSLVLVVGCSESSNSSAGGSATSPSISPASIIVAGTPPAVGASSQFTALAVRPDGSTLSVTTDATWQSSATSIATVSRTGIVTALAAGTVEISATYNSVKGVQTITVGGPPTFTVRGTVTDATTYAPLASSTVTISGGPGGTKSATANSSGQYSMAGLSGGDATITAYAADHSPSTRSIRVLADMTADFALAPALPCPSIGFDGLAGDGAPFATYTSCGFTVAPITSNLLISTGYGHPAPFIEFKTAANVTTTAEVLISAAGRNFRFQSVDVYSSTTPIPYVITGIAGSATVLSINGTQGNTFGNFATVVNPQPQTVIDALVIKLTNPAWPCCPNPMGIDNIVLAR